MAEKHYNTAGTHVLVYNPETDGRWECPPDYLPAALARGWELAEPVEEAPADEPQKAPAQKTAPKARTRKTTPTPGD